VKRSNCFQKPRFFSPGHTAEIRNTSVRCVVTLTSCRMMISVSLYRLLLLLLLPTHVPRSCRTWLE